MKMDWTMTFGNLITIVGGIISVVAIWIRLGQRVENVERDVAKQSLTLDELTRIGLITTLNQHERRINSIETSVGDIHEIKNDIKWIKATLTKGA